MRLDGGCTKSSVAASVEKVNAWATKAYISGSFRAGNKVSVEYRVKGSEEWTSLDASAVTETGSTSYSAELTGLQSGTDYEVRALAGGSEGEAYSFQTETIVTLPNMNFETWTQDGKLGILIRLPITMIIYRLIGLLEIKVLPVLEIEIQM